MSGVEAWHFLPTNGCLQFAPYTKVEVGQHPRARRAELRAREAA